MEKLQHNRPCGFANLQKRRHHTVCHLRITGFDLMFQNRAGFFSHQIFGLTDVGKEIGKMCIRDRGSTLPNFILGILLIFIFSLKLRILPSGGIGTPQHFLMPVIALSVGPIANVARLTRSSLLDVIGQEHLDCARAKGMREWKVVLKHGLRNALIPVITILGAQLSAMIGGSVVVETVFAWPGIGTLIVSSAQQRDFPVVVFGVLVISASVTFVNLLVDLSYGLLDQRIRDH